MRFLGKTLLAFALLHFVLQGQTCLLLQVSLDFLLLHSNRLKMKWHLFFFLALVLKGLIGLHAAAAAKSLQSCPTLCDPIDSSPPGPPSLGFTRQEHWSGLTFPFLILCSLKSDSVFSGGSVVKNPPPNRRCGFDPWVRKIPWRRKWQYTPVCLPGKSHEQRSLAGYNPWGPKELDITDWLNNNKQWLTRTFVLKVIQKMLKSH